MVQRVFLAAIRIGNVSYLGELEMEYREELEEILKKSDAKLLQEQKCRPERCSQNQVFEFCPTPNVGEFCKYKKPKELDKNPTLVHFDGETYYIEDDQAIVTELRTIARKIYNQIRCFDCSEKIAESCPQAYTDLGAMCV